MFTYAAISKRIARKLDLNATDVFIVAQTIRRRSWPARNGPGLLGVGTLVAWIVLFGKGTDLLEKAGVDVLGGLYKRGALGHVTAFLLGWGVGLLLAVPVTVLVRHGILKRQIRAMPRDGAGRLCVCDECLYPMEHAEPGEVSRCPECGTEYFRREASSERGLPP